MFELISTETVASVKLQIFADGVFIHFILIIFYTSPDTERDQNRRLVAAQWRETLKLVEEGTGTRVKLSVAVNGKFHKGVAWNVILPRYPVAQTRRYPAI